jgi:hypothetical protein
LRVNGIENLYSTFPVFQLLDLVADACCREAFHCRRQSVSKCIEIDSDFFSLPRSNSINDQESFFPIMHSKWHRLSNLLIVKVTNRQGPDGDKPSDPPLNGGSNRRNQKQPPYKAPIRSARCLQSRLGSICSCFYATTFSNSSSVNLLCPRRQSQIHGCRIM